MILPTYTENTDQNIVVACSSNIMKEDILDKFESLNYKSTPSEYVQDEETEKKFLSTNENVFCNNASREKSASEICTECGLEFGNKTILEIHMSVVHINPITDSNNSPSTPKKQVKRKRSTPTDDPLLKAKAQKVRNIKSVHEKEKPYKCTICDISFTAKASLNGHISSVHEKQKPQKCTICDTSFAQIGNLQRHIASVHEKKKQHKCTICGSSFAANGSLKSHTHFNCTPEAETTLMLHL